MASALALWYRIAVGADHDDYYNCNSEIRGTHVQHSDMLILTIFSSRVGPFPLPLMHFPASFFVNECLSLTVSEIGSLLTRSLTFSDRSFAI